MLHRLKFIKYTEKVWCKTDNKSLGSGNDFHNKLVH